jgi:hypothetical protein
MANSDKNIRITTSKNKATFPNIVFTGSAAGTSVITLEVLDDNTLSFSSNEGQVFSLDANLSTGTIWSVNDISGVPLLRASAGATVTFTEFSGGVGIGLTNPSTEVYKLQVKGQVAFGGTADNNNHFIFDTSSSAVHTNSFQLRRGALAQFFEDGDAFKTTFRANASQAADANYTWPVALPGTGTSILQSDTSGTLTWVGMAAGGSGSGTVNSGTGGSFAVYGSTGTAVIGTNLVTFSGSGVTIGGTINASSTTAAALVVQGGLGITGNAFIGGTTTITNTTESTSTTSGALTVAGGAGIAKSLFVGTTLAVGSAPGYNIPNLLGSFVSNVNSYNQLVIQNRSSGVSASSNLVVNNDQSTDAIFYGELGMNSSNFSGTGALGTANAVYVASTSAPLVLGTTTQHPIRFAVNGSATDALFIEGAGIAISVLTNLDLRSQNDIRFFNATNSNYAALHASNVTNNYTLSLPTAPVGGGSSIMVIGSDSNMYFAAPGSGIAFSSATSNAPVIRTKRPLTLQFCTGYSPFVGGIDTAVLTIPESAVDGTTQVTYRPRKFTIRVNTTSASTSRIQLEKSSGPGFFTLAATGSSYLGGLGLTLGAGVYTTSTTTFAGVFLTSGDNLRLNWTQMGHTNYSVQLLLEEV